MATRDDDSFTAPPERLLQDAQARPDGDEPAWVRARAVELLHSMDDFQVPLGGKQRLLLRLGQGWRGRRVAWLRPVVVGAILIGIGGGAIASAALTEWPAWVVRSYRKLMSASADSLALPPAPERRTAGEPARPTSGPWRQSLRRLRDLRRRRVCPPRLAGRRPKRARDVRRPTRLPTTRSWSWTRRARCASNATHGARAPWRAATSIASPPARWPTKRWPSASKRPSIITIRTRQL